MPTKNSEPKKQIYREWKPDTPDMAQSRRIIIALADELTVRAVSEARTPERLSKIYYTSKFSYVRVRQDYGLSELRPENIWTFGRLFGFADDWRKYAQPNDKKPENFNPLTWQPYNVTHRHLLAIDYALTELEIYRVIDDAAKFTKDQTTWPPYLKFAYERVCGHPYGEPGDAAQLSAKHDELEPASDKQPAPIVGDKVTDDTTNAPILDEAEVAVPSRAVEKAPTEERTPAALNVSSPPLEDDTGLHRSRNDQIPIEDEQRPLDEASLSSDFVTSRSVRRRFLSQRIALRAVAILLIGVAFFTVVLGVYYKFGWRPAPIQEARLSYPRLKQVLGYLADAKPYTAVVDHHFADDEPNSWWYKIDAPEPETPDDRLVRAYELRNDGKTAEADKIIQDVISDFTKTKGTASKAIAKVHTQLARLAYLSKHFAEAVSETQEAVKYDSNALTNNEAGGILQDRDQFAGALQYYDKAIAIDPNFASAHNNRGTLFIEQQPPDLEKAIESFNAAISIDPNFKVAYGNRAGALFMQKKYDLAKLDFTRAAGSSTEVPDPYNGLGLVAAAQGNYDQAIKSFDQALAINPTYLPALVNRAAVNMRLRNIDQAIQDLKSALDVVGDDRIVHVNLKNQLAAAYMETRRFDTAIEEFRSAPRPTIPLPATTIALGQSYASAGRYDEAAKSLETAARADPFLPGLYLARGNLDLLRGNSRAAASDFESAIRLSPTASGGYFGRGVARYALGDPDASVDLDLAEQLSLDPTDIASARIWRCLTTNKGDCLKEALSPIAGDKNGLSRYAVAQVYWLAARASEASGTLGAAADRYETARKYDPCQTRILVDEGQLFERMGNEDGALAAYDKSIQCGEDRMLVYLKRGELHLGRQEDDFASEDFQKVLTFNPTGRTLALALTGIADAHTRTDPDQRIKDLAKVLPEYDADLGRQAHLARAKLFAERAEYAEQIKEYDALLGGRERWPELLKERAIAYRALGQFSKAIADFTQLTEWDPRSITAWDDLGDTLYASGDFDGAITSYSKALEVDPFAGFVAYDRGKAFEMKKDDSSALGDYAAAERSDIRTHPDVALRAYLMRVKNDPSAAARELSNDFENLNASAEWKAVLSLFKGDSSSEAALEGTNSDQWWQRYFIARWMAAHGDTQRAKTLLADALREANKTDVRYFDIVHTLAQLR